MNSYRRAIDYGFSAVAPKVLKGDARKQWVKENRFNPHRLRHNAATFLRRQFGVELAQIVLGHSTLAATLIYAEQNEKAAIAAMARVG